MSAKERIHGVCHSKPDRHAIGKGAESEPYVGGSDRYVMSEIRIRDFVLNLGPCIARPILHLLRLTLEVLQDCESDQPSLHGLYLLDEIKTAHESPSYQRFLAVVVDSAEQGGCHFHAALRTVAHAIEIPPPLSPDEEAAVVVSQVRRRAAERIELTRREKRGREAIISTLWDSQERVPLSFCEIRLIDASSFLLSSDIRRITSTRVSDVEETNAVQEVK